MNLSKKLEELKPYQLNCNVFDVYSYDGLSMQDLLCQFFTKINECVDVSNGTLDLANWLVNEGLSEEVAKKLVIWLEDGTLENIINVNLFSSLNDKITNIKNDLNKLTNYKTDDINVKMLGAKGDGVTDDYQVFKEAIDLCVKEKRNLYIPNGVYLISETLNLPSYVCLIGQSREKTILKHNGKTIINIEGDSILNPLGDGHTQNTNISNLKLYGDGLKVPTLKCKAASRLTFSNVFFYANKGCIVECVELFDVRWLDCIFEWGGTSDGSHPMINLKNEDGYEFNNNHYFYGCLFESYRGKVIKCVAQNNSEFKFTDCKFESSFSNSNQFEFENVGVINFTNCMVSAQGSDLNAVVDDIMSFKNCYDINVNISLYKWDNLNGNRSNYYIPKRLITIDSCYNYRFYVRIFNNSIRLKDDSNPYVVILNHPNDGSFVNVIKRVGDNHKPHTHYTETLFNNIEIKHLNEPTISLSSGNVAYQLGRISEGKFKCYRYLNGEESAIYTIDQHSFSLDKNLYCNKDLHLPKYPNMNSVGWANKGCIYYDESVNKVRVFINGQWHNVVTETF